MFLAFLNLHSCLHKQVACFEVFDIVEQLVGCRNLSCLLECSGEKVSSFDSTPQPVLEATPILILPIILSYS